MNRPAPTMRFVIVILVLVILTVCMPSRILAESKDSAKSARVFEGLIIDPAAVAASEVDGWKKDGFDSVVLVLDERFEAAVYQNAAKTITANGLDLYYWIEVGRNPTFAK